jgi:hypothetical protein
VIEAAIDYDRPRELPPMPGQHYRCFVDMSGGRHDSAACAIAHKDPDGVVVVDVVRARPAPHDPDSVVEEFVQLARAYGCNQITGDKFGGAWVEVAFNARGASYLTSTLSKSELYLDSLAAFAANGVKMPDDPKLLRELRCWNGAQRGKDVTRSIIHGTAATTGPMS